MPHASTKAKTKVRAQNRTYYDTNQLPLFKPESSWVPPTDWRDLSDAKIIGFDTETSDPNLHELGPGFIRGDARVVGVSLATDYGYKIYLPIGHSEGNVDPAQAQRYLRAQLGRANQTKVGANVMYDLESLWSLDVNVAGRVRDIQVAEPLLDEESEQGYALEVLANKYLGIGKSETLLDRAAKDYGLDAKKNMSAFPSKYVGQYAEDDAYLPIQVMFQQIKEIEAQNLRPVFDLETDLTKVLFAMRLEGVAVDLNRAAEVIDILKGQEKEELAYLKREIGREINVNSSDLVGSVLAECGLAVPTTAKGAYSITAEWLDRQDHPWAKKILELKRLMNMRSQFIEGFIVDKSINGRLHTNWHQLRDIDESEGRSRGTRSGRVASSKPNLTQVPSRHPVFGKMIRSLLIADYGKKWVKCDYSQQEPRFLLHFACLLKLPGAEDARQKYIQDPSTDYHQLIADLVLEKSGRDIGRRNAKDINLGGAYGMGKAKLRRKLNLSEAEAEEIFAAYHTGAPYVRPLSKIAMDGATARGFVKTILGRRRRFSYWERRKFINGEYQTPVTPIRDYEQACKNWGKENVVRAMVHKAVNASVQGSAADQIKQALVILDREGLRPTIQVYDEINGSYDGPEQAWKVAKIMEEAITTLVPFKVEPDMGDSWGTVKAL